MRLGRPQGGPGQGTTADDCALVSRSLERWWDAAEWVGPRYVLEVASPGRERPLPGPGHPAAERLGLPDEAHGRLRLPQGVDGLRELDDIQEAVLVVDWDGLRQR